MKVRWKLVAILAVPLAALLGLAGLGVTQRTGDARDAEQAAELTVLSAKVTNAAARPAARGQLVGVVHHHGRAAGCGRAADAARRDRRGDDRRCTTRSSRSTRRRSATTSKPKLTLTADRMLGYQVIRPSVDQLAQNGSDPIALYAFAGSQLLELNTVDGRGKPRRLARRRVQLVRRAVEGAAVQQRLVLAHHREPRRRGAHRPALQPARPLAARPPDAARCVPLARDAGAEGALPPDRVGSRGLRDDRRCRGGHRRRCRRADHAQPDLVAAGHDHDARPRSRRRDRRRERACSPRRARSAVDARRDVIAYGAPRALGRGVRDHLGDLRRPGDHPPAAPSRHRRPRGGRRAASRASSRRCATRAKTARSPSR